MNRRQTNLIANLIYSYSKAHYKNIIYEYNNECECQSASILIENEQIETDFVSVLSTKDANWWKATQNRTARG